MILSNGEAYSVARSLEFAAADLRRAQDYALDDPWRQKWQRQAEERLAAALKVIQGEA